MESETLALLHWRVLCHIHRGNYSDCCVRAPFHCTAFRTTNVSVQWPRTVQKKNFIFSSFYSQVVISRGGALNRFEATTQALHRDSNDDIVILIAPRNPSVNDGDDGTYYQVGGCLWICSFSLLRLHLESTTYIRLPLRLPPTRPPLCRNALARQVPLRGH